MKLRAHHAAALDEVLSWRRDVRHFRPEPLPETLIERLTAAMDHAPSVGNARPWRVLRIDSPALRAAIRADFARCNAASAARYEGSRRAQYDALKLAGIDVAPLQLAVFTELAPEAGHGLGRQTMPETLRQSTAMAIHTLWLVARANDVGLGMVSILEPARIAALLDVPETWAFDAYLCLGRAAFDDDTPLLERVGWQDREPTRWETR